MLKRAVRQIRIHVTESHRDEPMVALIVIESLKGDFPHAGAKRPVDKMARIAARGPDSGNETFHGEIVRAVQVGEPAHIVARQADIILPGIQTYVVVAECIIRNGVVLWPLLVWINRICLPG